MEFAALGCRFFLAIVFAAAALGKLRQRSEFAQTVQGYGLLPRRLVVPFAATLPVLELACALLLAVGLGTTVASLVLAALLGVFVTAVGINLVRGRTIECGCSNPVGPGTIGWNLVVQNAALICAALLVSRNAPSALALDAYVGRADPAITINDSLAVLACSTLALAAVSLVRAVARTHSQARATSRVTRQVWGH